MLQILSDGFRLLMILPGILSGSSASANGFYLNKIATEDTGLAGAGQAAHKKFLNCTFLTFITSIHFDV